MAEKKKPKDLDPKAKGAKVKGGSRQVTNPTDRKKFLRGTLNKVDRAYRKATDIAD